MNLYGVTEQVQSASRRLATISDLMWHWGGAVVLAITAYLLYNNADVLFLAAGGVGLFALLLFIRSVGVTMEWVRDY